MPLDFLARVNTARTGSGASRPRWFRTLSHHRPLVLRTQRFNVNVRILCFSMAYATERPATTHASAKKSDATPRDDAVKQHYDASNNFTIPPGCRLPPRRCRAPPLRPHD